MALGKEINDFVGAANGAIAMGQRVEQIRYMKSRRAAIKNANPNNFPTVQNAATKYQQQYGVPPPPAGGGNAPAIGASAAPDGTNPGDALSPGATPDLPDFNETYDDGGEVQAQDIDPTYGRAEEAVLPPVSNSAPVKLSAKASSSMLQTLMDPLGLMGKLSGGGGGAGGGAAGGIAGGGGYDAAAGSADIFGAGDAAGLTGVAEGAAMALNRGGPVSRRAIPAGPEPEYADGGEIKVPPYLEDAGGETDRRRFDRVAQGNGVLDQYFSYPGASAARMPLGTIPDREVPRQALPAGPEPRKALNDQTRVAAFDPENEGMPTGAPSVTRAGNDLGAVAPRQALALNPATNNGGDGLTPNADPNDPQSTNNVATGLQKAIHGGLEYAQHVFHLKGDGAALPGTDPHQAKGRRAFIDGVGAATPEQVQQLDGVINKGQPPNEAIWGIRRLEAIYRWYSMNGETDKANKAAFELMQYSAGAAAQYGHAALQSVYRGDMKSAAELVIKGHEMIPDGRTLKIGPDGKSVNVIDARTGATEGNMPFDPKALFNAALGLSNKSLYWDVLSHRAAGTAPGQKPGKTTSETDEELKKARTELIKARTNKIKTGPAGKPGQSGAMGALLDEIKAIDAKRGVAPITTPPQGAARAPNADGQGGVDPAEDTSGEADEDDRPAGQQGLNAPPDLKSQRAPDSVVRLRPPPAGSAAAPPDAAASAPSGGNGDGQPVGTAPGSIVNPSRAAGSPSLSADPDAVPDKEIWRDGGTSRPAPAGDQPRPYDEAHPGANPYSALLTKAASLPGREGVQARVLIQAKMHEFDKEIAAWNGRKKVHDASEKQRITSTGKEMRDAQKQQLKDTFISNVRPADRKKIDTDIGGAFDTAVATAKHGGKDPTKLAANEAADALEKNKDAYSKSVFSDPSVDPQRFKSIAADLMTTNPRPGALGAVHLATDLTRIDPQDATTRAFQPMGRDALGNVVVRSPSYGLVHIRPDTYADIVNVVKSRLKNAATEGKAAAEKAATDAGPRRSSEIVDRVKGAVSRAVDAATTMPPAKDRTLIDDIGDGGRAIAAGTRRALSGIPWGDNAAMEERIRGYRRP